ncbi:metalloregulator ArsR/SmtB family transcription factor [Dyadobacter chenwenxiniae]|uniref:Metalloregulator ArsR/SmtB family transcription factor n=1 Tax=Dyadobacter chenwenxiniae TaxID=2906456 RepID=A0A9X1PKR1_9BACT|nr:metalloregulator ArsR/SmtB family transcription factor [Dyadobacter chenwenxiniae]MCF0052154.1 metalloregulator ArsR/SmtB family transcription factor [Dyadobacter chenwenxiniae]MCF0062865.1 metalloregulator ArsR/SmtB family transcription factor [Dyadobacter chenwenxiniae]UON84960.1 metalloregulator ArsR/SmtB family transcription factor [Dyadobacter chenwenxiniae]
MSIEARRDVFQAIADPTRRQIISLVAHKSMNLNSIAENFDISRPAISQHIKILAECGMVVVRQEGRERFCEAKLDGLSEVSDWVDQYKQFWNAKFDALGSYLDKIQSSNPSDEESKTN